MTETDLKKWYVVRAVSGQENKIKNYIESEIERHGLSSFVEDVLVPTEKVEGEGFEPSKAEPPDLQSGPFDRLGTPPERAPDSAENGAPCQCAKRISAREMVTLCPGAPRTLQIWCRLNDSNAGPSHYK